jgi:hypothetical protein
MVSNEPDRMTVNLGGITVVPEVVTWADMPCWHISTSHGHDLYVINRGDETSRLAYQSTIDMVRAHMFEKSLSIVDPPGFSGDGADRGHPPACSLPPEAT